LVDYLTNRESLILEGEKLLGSKIGVTEEKFANSEIAWINSGMANGLIMAQAQLREKVKYTPSYTGNA
jgi:hypothetical protein